MIIDTITNASRYRGLHEGIDLVLDAVASYDAENFRSGRVSLDGDAVFLNFASYETHAVTDALTEAHRSYIDVMYMVEGRETVWVKPTDRLAHITASYDPDGDALLAKTDSDAIPVRLEKGSVLILFPWDAHAPGCHAEGACPVKKIIGKVRMIDFKNGE